MGKKEIRELMELMGWTQAEFAQQIDASQQAVSFWLRGLRNPTGPTRKYLELLLEEARKKAKQPTG